MKVTLTPYTPRHFLTYRNPCSNFVSTRVISKQAFWYERHQFLGRIDDTCSYLTWNSHTHARFIGQPFTLTSVNSFPLDSSSPYILFTTITPCPSQTGEGNPVNEDMWREGKYIFPSGVIGEKLLLLRLLLLWFSTLSFMYFLSMHFRLPLSSSNLHN